MNIKLVYAEGQIMFTISMPFDSNTAAKLQNNTC